MQNTAKITITQKIDVVPYCVSPPRPRGFFVFNSQKVDAYEAADMDETMGQLEHDGSSIKVKFTSHH